MMTDLPDGWVILTVPDGVRGETWSYPPSHGTETYLHFRADHTDPDSEWQVAVPAHVAYPLMHTGGYRLARPQNAVIVARSGFARLRRQDGSSASCSWAGAAFEPDEDGVVSVPVEAVNDLLSHGFVPAPPPSERLVPRRAKDPASAP